VVTQHAAGPREDAEGPPGGTDLGGRGARGV